MKYFKLFLLVFIVKVDSFAVESAEKYLEIAFPVKEAIEDKESGEVAGDNEAEKDGVGVETVQFQIRIMSDEDSKDNAVIIYESSMKRLKSQFNQGLESKIILASLFLSEDDVVFLLPKTFYGGSGVRFLGSSGVLVGGIGSQREAAAEE